MKTLDEVIIGIKEQMGLGDPILIDALHYLREYRKLDSLDAVAFPEDENPALTWNELKTMKGKPVWVEADDGKYKKWFIVGNFFSWFEKEDFDAHVNLYHYGSATEMSKEMYGFYWQAYRKERSYASVTEL